MKFKETNIKDLIICEPKLIADQRGYFFETFREDLLKKFLGYNIKFIQDNESFSSYGTIRGLHFQNFPYQQTKLVRVVKGEILDIVVDLRKESKTFGEHYKIKLSAKNKKQLLVPKNFAHGFIVTSKNAIVCYKVDNYFSKKHDGGVIFNDTNLNIDWEIESKDINISSKDLNLPTFNSLEL